jgi:subtilase family serine protease
MIQTSRIRAATVAALLLTAGHARADRRVPLVDNAPEAAVALAREGDAPRSKALAMQVYLAPRDGARLDRLLEAQQDPSSPRYHRWLSAAEYERRFGPTQQDVDAVRGWLVAEGFRVTFASASEARVSFEGTVATAERSFGVRIAGSRDGRHYGNVEAPRVPASLAEKITHVAGLDNLNASRMHTKIPEPFNNQLDAPHFGPPDVWTYHNSKPLLDAGLDGSGQCIAVLNGSDVDQESLAMFNTFFGLPPFTLGVNYDVVYPDGPPGIAPPPASGVSEAYSEAVLDVEWSHGIAPGAQIVLYAGNHPALGTQGLVNTLVAATTDNRCPVISISWAQCGVPKSFFHMLDNYYRRGAAQGQTIFVATGDVGVAGPTLFNRKTGGCQIPAKPTIEENAASPNVTAIGATAIRGAQYDAAGLNVGVGVPAEEVWKFNIQNFLQSATTGGVSVVFKKPKFQKGIKSVKFKKRAVPDICLGGGNPAIPGFWQCLDLSLLTDGVDGEESCTTGGGSSIGPPQWGAVIAIILQFLERGASPGTIVPLADGARVGNINPQLYAMAKANLGNLAAVGIRDVTVGDNGYFPLTGYNAGPGYDLASGWGSIDIATFVNAFVSAMPTSISPTVCPLCRR